MCSKRTTLLAAAVAALMAGPVAAQTVTFTDPTGDDKGPGNYAYPTDPVYTPGSFDLTELSVETKGDNVTFNTSVATKLEDPWGMGVGFAVQMMFIFIDTDRKEGSGHTEGLPGLNIKFDPKFAWDKVVILSPQKKARVDSEVRSKAEALAADIVVPARTTGRGKTISGKVKLSELGGGDPASWAYQVVVQSNEGFPAKTDLLTRKVNEYEGQHRYGGGNDGDCDPHVMDILAGKGNGATEEVELQHQQLSYECGEGGESVKMATLKMVTK
ncbi:MAG: glucodextranase DOMON-like domain-containing protein [Pseudomonadota bacterium]